MIHQKLMVNLATQAITEIEGDFKDLPGTTSNGSHVQLAGHVLATVNYGFDEGCIDLLHPETKAATGLIDVSVRYAGLAHPPRFHYYTLPNNAERWFDPSPIHHQQRLVWPSGTWSLIQTTVSIELYLAREFNLMPTLFQSILKGMSSSQLERDKALA